MYTKPVEVNALVLDVEERIQLVTQLEYVKIKLAKDRDGERNDVKVRVYQDDITFCDKVIDKLKEMP